MGTFTAGPTLIGTHKVLINGTEYEVKGGKCLINGTGYDIQKGRTLIGGTGYDITFAQQYDPVFANNTWEQIIDACHNNAVPDTWNVADNKPMTINGVDYQIDIIGKNHDDYSDGSGKAPLTFQMHDCLMTNYSMNSSNTNSGGWGSCALRTTLQSTIKGQLPSAVQSAIKPVTKKASEGGYVSTVVNSYNDTLFLLSEVEVFGSTTYSVSGEGTQYAYYKAGNSKVKKVNGSASYWWERSPRVNGLTGFCFINSFGYASASNASNSRGVAFGFCF